MEASIRTLIWGATSVYTWRYRRKSRKLHLHSLSAGQNLNLIPSSYVFHIIIIIIIIIKLLSFLLTKFVFRDVP